MNTVQASYETFKGEGLKNMAEAALEHMGGNPIGQRILVAYSTHFEDRIEDPALATTVAGINFENPVLVGAGWDKKGRAVHGLHALGFGGVEIGTVLPYEQPGNPQPRLWTIDKKHNVGLNRLGFNSLGMDAVEEYLQAAGPLPCPIGLNVGRNKDTPNEKAAEAHAQVIERLAGYASYVVLGISSPNTPNLRGLQDKEPLRELILAAKEATPKCLPLFIKIDSERSRHELQDMIEVGVETGLNGFVATNTYMGSNLKAKYGKRWANEAGGLSGSDPEYRARTTRVVKTIYEEAGDELDIIGVGGVDSAKAAIEKLEAGASAVQVVTAIRASKGRVAAQINRDLLRQMQEDGVSNVKEYIGRKTDRGRAARRVA